MHEPVEVTIHDISDVEVDGDRISCQVHCSSGTYVRTLAFDVGEALGVPAHLAELRRTTVGPFGLDGAVSWEQLENGEPDELWKAVLPPADMFPDWASVTLNPAGLKVVENGGVIEPNGVAERRRGADSDPTHGDHVRVLAPDGVLLAVAEVLPGGMLQPRVVLR